MDPDPPSRESVNGVSESVKEGPVSVNEVPEGDADFVVRKGAVEKRRLCKNPVKTRLIRVTEEENFRREDVRKRR